MRTPALFGAAALALAGHPAILQAQRQVTPTVTLTVTVPQPSADWKSWSSNPSIAMAMVQTTLAQPVAVTSTVSLLKDGQPLGQVPGSIRQLSAGMHVYRTPQLAAWSRMKWSGATGTAVQQSGTLPPGSYQLCVDVVPPPPGADMAVTLMAIHRCAGFTIAAQSTNEVVTRPMTVTPVPPPHLITPANHAVLQLGNPTFQWTPVVSPAAPSPVYLLRIVEVLRGETARMALAGSHPLLERELIGQTAFPYPASAPPLSAGKTYAWQVQALAMPRGEAGGVKPLGLNQGMSEIYTFSRAASQAAGNQPQVQGPSTLLYNAALSGRLVYTFQPNGVPKPRQVATYLGQPSGGMTMEMQGQPGGHPVVGGQQSQPAPSGGGQPPHLGEAPRTDPLAGVTVRLVVRYRTAKQWIPYGTLYAAGKSYSDNNKVVASATTGSDGHFTFFFHDDLPTGLIAFNTSIASGSGEFAYHESGANLARFYTVEVGDPHYANPADELERQPGNADVGTLVALVRSYALRVTVLRAGTKATRTGMRVQILRPYRPAGVPANEGTAKPPRSKFGLFEIIAEGTTGNDGSAMLFHLVKNVGSSDHYVVRVSSDPNNVNAAYFPASVSLRHAMLLDDSLGYDGALFNQQYTPRLYQLTVPVVPRPPEYFGTILRSDGKKPVSQALMVLLQPGVGSTLILHAVKPEDDGKFSISGFQVNKTYQVYVVAPGFRPDSFSFQPDSGVREHHDHTLVPDATITLALEDEHGTPVSGRVTVGAGAGFDARPVFGNQQGQYLMPIGGQVTWTSQSSGGGQQAHAAQQQISQAQQGGHQARQAHAVTASNASARQTQIVAWQVTIPANSGRQVIHVDAGPQYFATDTTLNIPTGASDLGKAVVYLRLRRLRVKVVQLPEQPAGNGQMRRKGQPRVMRLTGGQQRTAIKGAVVTLPNENGRPSATTDANGFAEFSWKATSPDSIEQVTVQIAPPAGSDYLAASPQVPVPESRTPVMSVLGLASGATVQGTVYGGAGTDSAVVGARVFVPGAGVGGVDLEDTTDAAGHYTLHGAPAGTHWIRAGKAGSHYTGDSAQVAAKPGSPATRDFHLTLVNELPTELLGLPIEVSSYKKTAQGALLSGRFTTVPSNGAFAPQAGGLTLQFDSVTVSGTASPAPKGGAVHVAESDLPLMLFGKYLVRQHESGGLTVADRGDGTGAVTGLVEVLPGSFPLNSAELTFGAPLHLLLPGASGAQRTRLPTLVAGGASPAPAAGYDVGTDQGGDLKLTVYGFEAAAAAASSHVTPAAMTLDATLHTAIPGVGDLKVAVPDLMVTPGTGAGTGLQPAKGDQALSFALGSWTLSAPSWSLEQGRLHLVQGGITVPMAAGQSASSIDFPFTGMEVTPTSLEGGNFGGGPILLGGFLPMAVTGTITFTRDTPTGPWKLFGDGGRIAALPGMASGDEIRIQSWNFLSNGSKLFSLESGGSVRLYNTGDLTVSNLGITPLSVSLAGGLDLHVPGLDPQAVVIDYTRPVASQPPVFKFNPIDIAPFDIGGPLVSVQQGTLDQAGFHGNGTVTVPKKFSVASSFQRTPMGPGEKIEALPLSNATLDVGQIAIAQLKGGARVSGGQWATKYQGHLDVNGQVSGDLSIGVQGTNVNAGTGGLAVKNIPTPFGNMALTMNFPEQRLEGSVQTDKDIASGAHITGTSEMVISGNPARRYWYFFTGAGFSLKTPHLSGSAALLIGDATLDADLLARFKTYAKRDVPGQFHIIHGFFMEGEASIPVPVCPNGSIDIGVADIEVWCNITGDVRFGANFQQANTYFIGIGAGIDAGVKGGVGMGLCVHVSAGVKAGLDGEGAYRSDGAWFARGTATFDVTGSASYGVGLDDVCLDHSTSVRVGLGAEAQIGYDWATGTGPHVKVYYR